MASLSPGAPYGFSNRPRKMCPNVINGKKEISTKYPRKTGFGLNSYSQAHNFQKKLN